MVKTLQSSGLTVRRKNTLHSRRHTKQPSSTQKMSFREREHWHWGLLQQPTVGPTTCCRSLAAKCTAPMCFEYGPFWWGEETGEHRRSSVANFHFRSPDWLGEWKRWRWAVTTQGLFPLDLVSSNAITNVYACNLHTHSPLRGGSVGNFWSKSKWKMEDESG